MLKLVHVQDMNFKSVLEYYNYFVDNGYTDINCYTLSRLFCNGEEDYYAYCKLYEENMYYLVDDNREDYIIGFGSIEDGVDFHKEFLNTGNIAYGVRPNERNKGYGSKIMELLLDKCIEKGMEEVCVSCERGNFPSRRIILKYGGVFDKLFYDDFEGPGEKYWIKLDKPKNRIVKKLTNENR